MPGPRLTPDERRRIARGLTAGSDYAEIARQLGRPTSTVTREIARNGGPHAYSPERAQQASVRRARRRPAREPVEPADAHGRDPAAVLEFVEQLAAAMTDAGVPRMPARLLSCLLATDSGSLTAAALAARLRISPASISKAVAYLEKLGLLRRERQPASRRDRYVIDDDVWIRAWTVSAHAHAAWAHAATQGIEILGSATSAGERMASMSAFFAALGDTMAGSHPTAPGAGSALADDTLTVVAALAHARAPLTATALAGALDWPTERATQALRRAEQLAAHTDPVTIARHGSDGYLLSASPGRLTPTQRRALHRHSMRTS